LARQALTKRKSYQETAEALQAQLEQQSSIVTRLKQDMRMLESKISEAKTKKDMYIARARSAEATQRLNEMLGNVTTGNTLGAFERMEEKVIQLEAQSEAIATLGTADLEKKFLTIEDTDDIDTELAYMKAQILTGKNPTALPSTEPPPTNNN
jgi:phage shock protein A